MMGIRTRTSAEKEHTMAHAAHGKTLYEALEGLPEGVTGEILKGQLHAQPRPAGAHVLAASRLGALLGGTYDLGRAGSGGGWWILDEPELHLRRNTEVLVPDLAGWRRERMPELPADQRFDVVPDWICEILSPATRSKAREIKMPIYARYGVAFAWLLDPEARALEAYALHEGQWSQLGEYVAPDTVGAEPFEAAELRPADLWR